MGSVPHLHTSLLLCPERRAWAAGSAHTPTLRPGTPVPEGKAGPVFPACPEGPESRSRAGAGGRSHLDALTATSPTLSPVTTAGLGSLSTRSLARHGAVCRTECTQGVRLRRLGPRSGSPTAPGPPRHRPERGNSSSRNIKQCPPVPGTGPRAVCIWGAQLPAAPPPSGPSSGREHWGALALSPLQNQARTGVAALRTGR